MPQLKQPNDLKSLCLKNIYTFVDFYWLCPNQEIKQLIDGRKLPLYFIGPFESLSYENVDDILKKLYTNGRLKKIHLFFFLHNHLRKIDLRFIKKSSYITGNVCQYLGNNCFVSLLELK